MLEGGRPPPEFQCQARLKRHAGQRCGKWALRGKDYCQFHGGRRDKHLVCNEHLPMFYSKHLTGTLKAYVETCTGIDPNDQLSLFEELALVRHLAGDSIRLYQGAQQSGKPELLSGATALMREALSHVVKTCEAAARIDALAKDKISIHNLTFLVEQIVRIAFKTLDEDDARRFEVMVRSEIRIQSGPDGTMLTPDMDVTAMDDTIPKEEDDVLRHDADT